MNPKTGSVSDWFWVALVVVEETVVVVNVPFFSPWLSSSRFGALKFSTPTESIYIYIITTTPQTLTPTAALFGSQQLGPPTAISRQSRLGHPDL